MFAPTGYINEYSIILSDSPGGLSLRCAIKLIYRVGNGIPLIGEISQSDKGVMAKP